MSAETKTKQQEKREEQEALNDLIAVMQMPQGRRLIWRILARANIFGRIFSGQSNQTFFDLGRRDVGVWLMAEAIQAKPELYLLMQQEHYLPKESTDD